MENSAADFIVVGGGLSGSVLAARLKQGKPSLKVVLIEAGPNLTHDPRTKTFGAGLTLPNTSFDWAFPTVPQTATDNRTHTIGAGKALGGGSLLNYGGWGRACSNDYDLWASVVEDEEWSFNSMLPYFRKTETFYDGSANKNVHGFDGPIQVTSPNVCEPKRDYGMREPLYKTWTEAGVSYNKDPTDGSLLGISQALEN